MATEKLADQQLIRNYLNGNDYSFELLLRRHQDRVFNYINKLVKNTDVANDIFQDTFIKVISTLKRGMYNEEGKFLPWVMRIAHNLVIDYFRNSSKMPVVGRKNTAEGDEFDIFQILKLEDCTVEDELVEQQIYQDLRALVDLLPLEQREVVKMRHFMGMSFKDIADTSDVSINTALGRMRYALINLRKMIKDHDVMLTVS